MKPVFGNIGVCVADYTKESLYELLEAHGLEDLIDDRYLSDSMQMNPRAYLQSESAGLYKEDTTVSVYPGFIHYVVDIENFLHVLRVGILDPDAANSLVNELYSQGLIKLRKVL